MNASVKGTDDAVSFVHAAGMSESFATSSSSTSEVPGRSHASSGISETTASSEQESGSVVDASTIESKIDMRFAARPLTARERDAAQNAVQGSNHTRMQVLPNHALGESGMLQGFVFTCDASDKASVLPVTREMFRMTTVYECSGSVMRSTFNEHALRITADLGSFHGKLLALREKLTALEKPQAKLACIPDADEFVDAEDHHENRFEDQDWWLPSMPMRVGVYHGFRQAVEQDARQHTLYVVVTGCENYAADEVFNLWQDSGEHMTAQQFAECEEVDWLRRCTLRSQQRVAAIVAQQFGLEVSMSTDFLSPKRDQAAVPFLQTVTHDLLHDAVNGKVMLTNNGTFLHNTKNGVAFDVFSSEGVWLFQGPVDVTNFHEYGGRFRQAAHAEGFPTASVKFHPQYHPQGNCKVVMQYMTSQNHTLIDAARIQYEKQYAEGVRAAMQSDLRSILLSYESQWQGREDYVTQSAGPSPRTPRTPRSPSPAAWGDMRSEHDAGDGDCAGLSHVWHAHENLHAPPDPNAETGTPVNGAETHHAIVYTDVSHHRGRFMYPDEAFLMSLQKLGYDRNDGMVILMPLCVIYDDENS